MPTTRPLLGGDLLKASMDTISASTKRRQNKFNLYHIDKYAQYLVQIFYCFSSAHIVTFNLLYLGQS